MPGSSQIGNETTALGGIPAVSAQAEAVEELLGLHIGQVVHVPDFETYSEGEGSMPFGGVVFGFWPDEQAPEVSVRFYDGVWHERSFPRAVVVAGLPPSVGVLGVGQVGSLAAGLGGYPGRMGGRGDVVLLSTDVAAAIADQLSPRWILQVQLLAGAVVVDGSTLRVPVVGDVDERTARAAAGVALRMRDLEQDLQASPGRLEVGSDLADPTVGGSRWVFHLGRGDR